MIGKVGSAVLPGSTEIYNYKTKQWDKYPEIIYSPFMAFGGWQAAVPQASKNQEAAWIFMQWACSKEIMTQCTLAGGFAPMRLSSFADERVKAKAKVMPGTTRHLETVKWTIDNVMASEPDMPLWAGYSTNELPTELGKLVTGQDYGGDAKKCMDAVAAMIDRLAAVGGALLGCRLTPQAQLRADQRRCGAAPPPQTARQLQRTLGRRRV